MKKNTIPRNKTRKERIEPCLYECSTCCVRIECRAHPLSCARCYTSGSLRVVDPREPKLKLVLAKQPDTSKTPLAPVGEDDDDIDALVFEDRELTMLSDVEPDEFEVVPSNMWSLDRTLDGGLVIGGVFIFAGEKGVGKTTISTQIVMRHVLEYKDARVFLASGEEGLGRFKQRALRLGYTQKQLDQASKRIGGCRLKNIESVHAEAQKLKPTMIVYDSMPKKFLHPAVTARKTELHAPMVMEEMVDFCSAFGVIGIVVARMTQDGHIAGGEDWIYDVDGAVLRLNRVFTRTKPPRKTRYVSVKCDKNRFGSEEYEGYFLKTERGLLCRNRPKFLRRKPKA